MRKGGCSARFYPPGLPACAPCRCAAPPRRPLWAHAATGGPMADSPRIDELVRRLLESIPPGLRSVQQDLESNFRAVLRSGLSRLDLVPRDEFDAQVRVLQ